MKKGYKYLASSFALLAGAGAWPQIASAQDVGPTPPEASGLYDTITVTARRREESLQDVPVLINVVDQKTLEMRGSTAPADLVQIVPGLQQNAFTDKSNVDWAVRGQTKTYGTLTQAVVTYFNDVVMPRVSTGEFYDLQNIQVLKGPQGTLFGRVTDGGAVLLRPVKPGNDLAGYAEVKLGNYSLRQYQGAVDLPIYEDKMLLRVAANINRRGGYTRNIFDGKDLDDVHQDSFRASLVLKPIDGLENYTVLSVTRANENGGGGGVLIGVNPLDFAPANQPIAIKALADQQARGIRKVNIGWSAPGLPYGGLYFRQRGTTLTNITSYEVASNLTLKNIFGYVTTRQFTGSDNDGIPNVGFIDSPNLPGLATFFNDRRLFSNEVQAQGTMFDGTTDFTVGFYWDKEDTPNPAEQFAVVANAIQVANVQYATTETKAAYGQISPKLDFLLPGLAADIGGRYTWDSVTSDNAQYYLFSANPVPGDLPRDGQCLTAAEAAQQFPVVFTAAPCERFKAKFKRFSYNLGLNYRFSRNGLIYASLKTGYRPGGFNASTGGLIDRAFGPETSVSKEVGVKADWTLGDDTVLRTNLTLFWDKIKNLQTYVSDLNAQNNIVSTGVISGVPQKVRGLEFEAGIKLFRALSITANWAHTTGKFITDGIDPVRIAAACPADPYTTPPAKNGLLCPLRKINNLPKDTINVTANYSFDLGQAGTLTLGGNLYHTSSFVPGSQNSLLYPNPPYAPFGGTMPGYSIFNLNASWDNVLNKPLTLTGFITNVGNKAYIQSVTGYLEAGSLGPQTAFYGAPRMYGLSLRYRFGE